MIAISVVTQLSHRRRMRHATEWLDERCAIGGMSFRSSIIKLSSSTRVHTAPRCIPQTNASGKRSHCATWNNYGANNTFGPTWYALYNRYTMLCTENKWMIRSERDATLCLRSSLFFSLPLPPSLSLAMRKCASYAHRLDDADNCIPFRSHSWWKSTMVRRPRGQWGSVGVTFRPRLIRSKEEFSIYLSRAAVAPAYSAHSRATVFKQLFQQHCKTIALCFYHGRHRHRRRCCVAASLHIACPSAAKDDASSKICCRKRCKQALLYIIIGTFTARVTIKSCFSEYSVLHTLSCCNSQRWICYRSLISESVRRKI